MKPYGKDNDLCNLFTELLKDNRVVEITKEMLRKEGRSFEEEIEIINKELNNTNN